MSGPYVIVNRYTEEAWGRSSGPDTYARKRDAQAYATRMRMSGKFDTDESTVMPLAQYLVEYGL